MPGYRDAGGDPGDDATVAYFGACRAAVRAKIALLRGSLARPGAGGPAEARRLLALAERPAWHARPPLLLVVAGLSASGKTLLAEVLDARSGFRHSSSDAARKRLAGPVVDPACPNDEVRQRFQRRDLQGVRAPRACGDAPGRGVRWSTPRSGVIRTAARSLPP